MKGMGASLLVALSAMLGSATAEEADWRPARPGAAPARFTLVDHSLPVTLGRPLPAQASTADQHTPRLDPDLVRTSLIVPEPARPVRIVRGSAKAADLAPALLSMPDDAPPPPADGPGKSSPPKETPGKNSPPIAFDPWFHAAGVVPFPYPSTHWTRTNEAPGSDFNLAGMTEDPGDVGPPAAMPCRWYGSAEYLLWWTRPANLPPLVTTGPPASQGVLGQPGTVVLFGGSAVDFGGQSGARFTAGYWLDCEQTIAVEGSLFFLGQGSDNFSANSNVFPVLARPFFEVNPGPNQGEFRQLTAFPGLFTGSISASNASRLWGAELDARCKGCCAEYCGCSYRIDWLAGVRYLELNDSLHIGEAIQFPPGVLANLPAGGTGFVFDNFGTRNQFTGAQVGTQIELRHGCWSLDVKAKLAVGDTHETVNISGGQLLVSPGGGTTAFQGGLLALPSNSGHFTRDEFGVVPEIGLQVGYNFTEHLRVFLGYNFLYWSNVLRAGDQIDRNIDVTQIPNFSAPGVLPAGQSRPAVLFRDTSFWAQGMNVGLEWKY